MYYVSYIRSQLTRECRSQWNIPKPRPAASILDLNYVRQEESTLKLFCSTFTIASHLKSANTRKLAVQLTAFMLLYVACFF